MEMFAQGILYPLPCHVFEAEEVIDAFRFMQQARHIGKIVVTYRNGLKPMARPSKSKHRSFSSTGGTCLITGGLSGFGLKTAEWLAEKGTRHLVLISRSGPTSSEAWMAVERLKNKGVDVLAVSCDVTDRHALEKLLETIAQDMPPLKGIVHAAVVIEDGLSTLMNQEQIYRVLAPKILGAQHLHQLTLDMDLDFSFCILRPPPFSAIRDRPVTSGPTPGSNPWPGIEGTSWACLPHASAGEPLMMSVSWLVIRISKLRFKTGWEEAPSLLMLRLTSLDVSWQRTGPASGLWNWTGRRFPNSCPVRKPPSSMKSPGKTTGKAMKMAEPGIFACW